MTVKWSGCCSSTVDYKIFCRGDGADGDVHFIMWVPIAFVRASKVKATEKFQVMPYLCAYSNDKVPLWCIRMD